MHARIFGLWLSALALAPAQQSVTADDLRAMLDDTNIDLTKLSQAMAGKKGGNQLFYFPTRDEPAAPAAWGLKFETIGFKSADDTALHGWFIPAKGKTAKSAKATVVFSHGNAGSIGHHLGFCTWLTVDTALRLERYFGWPAEVWLNLQSHHDPQTAKASLKSALAEIQPCPAL